MNDATLVSALLEALKWAVWQLEDDLDPDHQTAIAECKATIARAENAVQVAA